MSRDWLVDRPGRDEDDLERETEEEEEEEEEERARDLPGTVAARLGGCGSIRGLPSCRGLIFILAVSWGIFRVFSRFGALLAGSFLPSSGWQGPGGAVPPSGGSVLKRTARLSPKKE